MPCVLGQQPHLRADAAPGGVVRGGEGARGRARSLPGHTPGTCLARRASAVPSIAILANKQNQLSCPRPTAHHFCIGLAQLRAVDVYVGGLRGKKNSSSVVSWPWGCSSKQAAARRRPKPAVGSFLPTTHRGMPRRLHAGCATGAQQCTTAVHHATWQQHSEFLPLPLQPYTPASACSAAWAAGS